MRISAYWLQRNMRVVHTMCMVQGHNEVVGAGCRRVSHRDFMRIAYVGCGVVREIWRIEAGERGR